MAAPAHAEETRLPVTRTTGQTPLPAHGTAEAPDHDIDFRVRGVIGYVPDCNLVG